MIKAGGKKLALFLSICIFLYSFGCLIGYQIIIASLIQYAIVKAGVDPEFGNSKEMTILIAVPMAALFLWPLSLKRDMSAFRNISVMSICALMYTAIVLCVELPSYFNHYHETAVMKPIYIDMNIFSGFAMTSFAYTCQLQLLPIYSELKNPEYDRMEKVIKRSLSLDLIFYLLIGLVGFFSSFDQTATIVLERDSLPGKPIDYPIILAVFGNCICVAIAYPVVFNPFR